MEHPIEEHNFSFFCAKGSKIHDCLIQNNVSNIYTSPPSALKRILWQKVIAPRELKKLKPDVIYQIFGYSAYPKKYCQVCGEADSNLFFPEVDFWCELPKWKKIFKKWKDLYRIQMLKRADGVVFENQAMLNRCSKLFPKVFQRSCFIKPSINKVFSGSMHDTNEQSNSLNSAPSVLMLCSWQPNKNYSIMPAVIKILKDRNYPIHFRFSVSADDTCEEAIKFRKQLKDCSVEEYVDFLGPVSPEKIAAAYSKSDAILLLSKLESFSNNIIEAWTYRRPIIVSDMEWSHAIIGEAGYYVNRDNPEDIADAIQKVCSDNKTRSTLVHCGIDQLKTYPDISQHVHAVISFLCDIKQKTA